MSDERRGAHAMGAASPGGAGVRGHGSRDGGDTGPSRPAEGAGSDVVSRTAGLLTGVYADGYLDALRDEWDRPDRYAGFDAVR